MKKEDKLYDPDYYQDNRVRHIKNVRKWQAKNKDKMKEYRDKYYQSDKFKNRKLAEKKRRDEHSKYQDFTQDEFNEWKLNLTEEEINLYVYYHDNLCNYPELRLYHSTLDDNRIKNYMIQSVMKQMKDKMKEIMKRNDEEK